MAMLLRMETRLAMIQSLQAIGGSTTSIFPQVEALLIDGDDYMEALGYVASRKNIERYQSVMDFLFCELYPEYRFACQRFYSGNGPQLKELITVEQLVEYNEQLLIALQVARDCLKETRFKSWTLFRKLVIDAVAA